MPRLTSMFGDTNYIVTYFIVNTGKTRNQAQHMPGLKLHQTFYHQKFLTVWYTYTYIYNHAYIVNIGKTRNKALHAWFTIHQTFYHQKLLTVWYTHTYIYNHAYINNKLFINKLYLVKSSYPIKDSFLIYKVYMIIH